MKDHSSIFCPYPGLRPFTEEEALYFQGREKHIVKIKEELQKRKFLMVTGASGDGKSSLIFAGLIPSIKAGFFKARFGTWKISVFRPGNDPLTNFSKSLAPHFGADKETSIRSNLSLGYSSLSDLYKNSPLFQEAGSARGKTAQEGANLLIVVDQFEEFFTNKENFNRETAMPSTEANTAVNLLIETTRIAREEDLSIYIVCTMRSDYIGNAPSFRGLPELIGKNQFFVPRLNRSEMLSAVTEPAVLAGAKISQRLAQRMLNDLSSVNTDVLPVLQHAVRRVWHVAQGGGEELDLWHYCAVGGMDSQDLPDDQGVKFESWFEQQPESKKTFYRGQKKSYDQDLSNVLNLHGNILFESAADYYKNHGVDDISKGEAQELLASIFRCLTKIDDSRAVRNRITLEEVTRIIDRKNYNSQKIGRLIDIYRDPENTLVYPFIGEGEAITELTPDTLLDITHEALIRNWRRLSKWTKEEYDSANVFRELSSQLERWIREGKSSTYLLTAGPYEYYHKWYEQQRPSADWLGQYTDSEIYKTDGITLSPLVEPEEGDEKPKRQTNSAQVALDLAEFLVDSKSHIDRVQKVRKMIVAAISVLLVISVGALGWALVKKNEATTLQEQIATTAEANRIATTAYTQLEQDPTLAFRLAEASYNIEPTPLNKQVIMGAYSKVPFYLKLVGHTDGLRNCVISPDGKYIVTGSKDNDFRVFDFTGKCNAVLKGHLDDISSGVHSIAISSDSKYILTCSEDSTAKLWDVTGKCVTTFEHNGPVNSVHFSSDNRNVLTGSSDSTARIWDLKGNVLITMKHGKRVQLAVFSPFGNEVLTSGMDKAILWNIKGEFLRSHSFDEDIYEASYSNNGKYIATGGTKGSLSLFDSNLGILEKWKGHKELIGSISFDPHDSLLLSASDDLTLGLWNLNGDKLSTFRGHTAAPWSACFSSQGNRIGSASDDGTARIWDLKGNQLMRLNGHSSQVMSIMFAPDGNSVVTSSGDGTGRLWVIEPEENPILKGHTGFVVDVEISPGGETISTTGWDYTSRLWGKNGEQLGVMKSNYYANDVGKFSPKNKYFITSDRNILNLWDLDGNKVDSIEGHSDHLTRVLFSEDGSLFISNSLDNTARVWSSDGDSIHQFNKVDYAEFWGDNNQVYTLNLDSTVTFWKMDNNEKFVKKAHVTFSSRGLTESRSSEIMNLSISKNGKWLAFTAKDSSIGIWGTDEFWETGDKSKDLTTINLDDNMFNINVPDLILSTKFSPIDNLLISVSNDNIIRLWNVDGSLLAKCSGHSDYITDVNFSSDGKLLVSASADKSVRLWDLNGSELQYFPGHTAYVNKVMFSPDGNYILSASDDFTARLIPWRVEDVLNKINIDKVRGEVWQLGEADKRVFGITD